MKISEERLITILSLVIIIAIIRKIITILSLVIIIAIIHKIINSITKEITQKG